MTCDQTRPPTISRQTFLAFDFIMGARMQASMEYAKSYNLIRSCPRYVDSILLVAHRAFTVGSTVFYVGHALGTPPLRASSEKVDQQ